MFLLLSNLSNFEFYIDFFTITKMLKFMNEKHQKRDTIYFDQIYIRFDGSILPLVVFSNMLESSHLFDQRLF